MSIVPDHPEEQEREHLYCDGARHYKHVPDLAYRWLEELIEQDGLPDVSSGEIRIKGRLLRRPIREDPANTPSDLSTYPARLDNGQVIWVRFDEKRSSTGHRCVSVVDKPNRIRAILAALTVLESRQTDIATLRSVLPFLEPSHPINVYESHHEAFKKRVGEGDTETAVTLLSGLSNKGLDYRSLEYAVALLRYFRPDFDSLPLQDQRDLLEKCCERMNKFLEAARHLNEFLEYGSPDKDQRPGLENPHRDAKAAALRDIEGRTYREIADLLEVKISEKAKCVGDYSTVIRMVARGREVLERAFGRKGWQDKAEAARFRYQRWKSLLPQEQFIEGCAEDWGVSLQLARMIIVEGLEPNAEQAEAAGKSDFNIEDARETYKIICEWHAQVPHMRIARSDDPGWYDVIFSSDA